MLFSIANRAIAGRSVRYARVTSRGVKTIKHIVDNGSKTTLLLAQVIEHRIVRQRLRGLTCCQDEQVRTCAS